MPCVPCSFSAVSMAGGLQTCLRAFVATGPALTLHRLLIAEKKKCPVCRASVDENRVRDLGGSPEASGRSFVQQAASPGGCDSKTAKPGGAGRGHIELQAVSGTAAAAAAAAAGQAWTSGLTPGQAGNGASLPVTPPELRGGGGGGSGAAASAWLPDIYPVRPGGPSLSIIVEAPGGASHPTAGPAPAAAAGSSGGGAAAAQVRTIRVVRPRAAWVKFVWLLLAFLALLAMVVIIPVVMSRDGSERECSSAA